MFQNPICVEDKEKEIPGNFQPYWHAGCSVCPVSTRNASIHLVWLILIAVVDMAIGCGVSAAPLHFLSGSGISRTVKPTEAEPVLS